MELNVVTVEETENVVIKTDAAIQTIEEGREEKEERVEKSSWKPIPAIYFDAVGREFRKSASSQTTKATQTKEFIREPFESRGS